MNESSFLVFSSEEDRASLLPVDFPRKKLSIPEMSLCHKHYYSYSCISKTDTSALILEDDVYFDPTNLDEFVLGLEKEQAPYDFIFFGTGCNLSMRGTGLLLNENRLRAKCTDSYVVTPKGAKALLSSVEKEGVHLPIDWDLNYRFLKLNSKVYWLEPGITSQGSQDGTYVSLVNPHYGKSASGFIAKIFRYVRRVMSGFKIYRPS
jgi:GR25 family glycosyltransferase involved in LPS biosynthesis